MTVHNLRPFRDFSDLAELSTRPQLAEFSGVSVSTLARWASEGVGPKITRLGTRAVRYRRADIVSWIESSTNKEAS